MADDILARARSLHGANWFLPGGEVNLPAVLEASGVLGELAAEVERLRGALNGLIPEWRDAVEADGGSFCGPEGKAFAYCADQIEAVLRGDQ